MIPYGHADDKRALNMWHQVQFWSLIAKVRVFQSRKGYVFLLFLIPSRVRFIDLKPRDFCLADFKHVVFCFADPKVFFSRWVTLKQFKFESFVHRIQFGEYMLILKGIFIAMHYKSMLRRDIVRFRNIGSMRTASARVVSFANSSSEKNGAHTLVLSVGDFVFVSRNMRGQAWPRMSSVALLKKNVAF